MKKEIDTLYENKDFTEDYPVNEYTKKSGVKVKAHTRREKIKEIEERMSPEQLKKLKTHYGMGVSGEIGRHERNKESLSIRTIEIFERKIAHHERWIEMYYREFEDIQDHGKEVGLSKGEKDRLREIIDDIDSRKERIKILESSIQTWKPKVTFTSL